MSGREDDRKTTLRLDDDVRDLAAQIAEATTGRAVIQDGVSIAVRNEAKRRKLVPRAAAVAPVSLRLPGESGKEMMERVGAAAVAKMPRKKGAVSE